MATTYEPIATYTSAGTTGITFTSFSGYTDLILIANGFESAGAYAVCRVNSDTGSNYSRLALRGNSSGATSAKVANETSWFPDLAMNPAGTILQFMNYSNATTYKTMLARFNDNAGTTAVQINMWRNTNAITTISLASSGGGSTLSGTFTLYGIKAA